MYLCVRNHFSGKYGKRILHNWLKMHVLVYNLLFLLKSVNYNAHIIVSMYFFNFLQILTNFDDFSKLKKKKRKKKIVFYRELNPHHLGERQLWFPPDHEFYLVSKTFF